MPDARSRTPRKDLVVPGKDTITFFVDALPSEQLIPGARGDLTITGVLCPDPVRIGPLRQFKDCHRWPERFEITRELTSRLASGELPVFAMTAVVSQPHAARLADEALAQLSSGIAKVLPDGGVRIHRRKVGAPTARALCAYAVALAEFAERLGAAVRQLGRKKVMVILDNLPSEPATAMLLLEELSRLPAVRPQWERAKRQEIAFETSNLRDGIYADGREFDGKNYEEMCLADWMTQSAFAATCPGQWCGVAEGRTPERLEAVAGVWRSLREGRPGQAIVIDLNRRSLAP